MLNEQNFTRWSSYLRAGCCIAALIVLVAGCSRNEQDLLPLSEGATWTYLSRSEFQSAVITQSVDRETPIGSFKGWVLKGDMGVSHLAWSGSRLLASRLGDTTFLPPITILEWPQDDSPTEWAGDIVTPAGKVAARSKLSVELDNDYTLEGRKIEAVKSTLVLESSIGSHEILTWYGKGLGILRQEQRRSGRLQISIEYLSGP